MNVQITELFKIVTPDKGKMLFDKTDNTYTDLVYIPLDNDPENIWSEVNIEDVPQQDSLDIELPMF